MASTIQSLPTEVVYLITAGEVIDSFASVVRELVENSLDAGATRIVVSLWSQQWRVRVADNGCGMNLDDLQQAATAHTTSKIHSSDDLWKIKSLGFRGEALHSLATLADLEIFSRPVGGNEGWQVVYGNDGEVIKTEVVAIASGTVVTVDNLFANYPARRQGLPNATQQMKAVQTIIQQIALCHPHITYQVWQNDREWFTICQTASPGKLIPQILTQIKPGDLKELKIEIPNPQSTINLVIGLPDRCHRHKPDWVKVAINGRIIKSPELEQTIFSAFHKTLPRDRYPVCFLHLTISPDQINWNRHPAKTEIYLNEINAWQEKISETINQAFYISEANLKDSVHTTRVSNLLKVAEKKGSYNFSSKNADTKTQNYLKAVAQVSNMYIVAEHPGGMWLVEQHIAHERVLYEKICDEWEIVPVETPIILYQLLPSQVAQLQRINLDIETFGEKLWAVRTVPTMLKTREDCAEALLELSLGGDLQTAQVAVACRSAIRNGTPMTLPEMQQLLDDWQRTRNPQTCPHGRPIYLSLEESALSRFFRRHWVVGKSHGI
ncbi:DNA mismatch repair endonuclease MutL [Anabaena aphanizomenioides LEGE 00250]|uniref:DNA mismatch repair protein MutL n=1 Tax=Sphaerospermopsis aphanizomenoides LEGE 00250 TaxID=2777972 RepID=A0ABR9VFP7_9CYAN|nr:DNA mismatch repair endonuclease MutL [Sphaerospermopsis aphanizomenoides]MBE9237298.1 DNA mismatch repair endonuclease MutL [Sphaerospermopsis aphanizomenoides LEGE 00250]